jgi:electron transport complex protein RnfB
MSDQESHMHYVCTPSEARELINGQESFWLANCGCRESRGTICKRSRINVCLQFLAQNGSGGGDLHPIELGEAEGFVRYAEEKKLVPRPFRDPESHSRVEGICFCCDDCCSYFLNPTEEICDPGAMVECTQATLCANCGNCVEPCYFGARKWENGRLVRRQELCYGCGLCVETCPNDAIEMVKR